MKELIQKIRDALKQTATRANDVLKTLPPLESFEKTSPIYAAILQTGYALDFIEQTTQRLNGELDAIDPEKAIKDVANAELSRRIEAGDLIPKEKLEEYLSKGDLMKKEDAVTAATKAADDREKEVRGEILLVEQRRREISTPKEAGKPALLSSELAARLSSDLLKKDDYLALATKVANRVKQLVEEGLEVPSLLNAAADTATDEEGDNVFSERLSGMKEVAQKASGGRRTAPEPLASGGGSDNAKANAAEMAACF